LHHDGSSSSVVSFERDQTGLGNGGDANT